MARRRPRQRRPGDRQNLGSAIPEAAGPRRRRVRLTPHTQSSRHHHCHPHARPPDHRYRHSLRHRLQSCRARHFLLGRRQLRNARPRRLLLPYPRHRKAAAPRHERTTSGSRNQSHRRRHYCIHRRAPSRLTGKGPRCPALPRPPSQYHHQSRPPTRNTTCPRRWTVRGTASSRRRPSSRVHLHRCSSPSCPRQRPRRRRATPPSRPTR